jgi:SAM-dependent methyltransferase
VRRFSADYLERTREGMWADTRDPLSPLALASRERVLDVGAGTGEFTTVLAEEAPSDATVVACDADPTLLSVAREAGHPVVVGDATRLPVADGAVDLVACQALLVNLPDPATAVRAFAAASSEVVGAVEPDNGDVAVSSTVDAETEVAERARRAYRRGVRTDVAPGERVPALFREAGLVDVRTRRYHHEKRIAPPYDEADLEAATRKASGAALTRHETELRRVLSDAAYDSLRRDWREMGRAVIDQMRDRTYERVEVVPFDVTVGRVPEPTGDGPEPGPNPDPESGTASEGGGPAGR